MSLNFSFKYILLILASIFFIFISVSGVLFLLLKYDLIYEYNYNFYPITERTSLEIEEIRKINNKIKNYFFDESEYLDVSIFNDKEIYHMKDVKEIINNISKGHNVKKGILMKSLRVAFFGSLSGPDLIQSWELFSENSSDISRIEKCLKSI